MFLGAGVEFFQSRDALEKPEIHKESGKDLEMRFTQRRNRFREILEGDLCVHPGSVFDPISARIAEDLNFEIGMLGGSIASFTVLGAPDLILLTLSELSQQIQRITRASELPLMVDSDHGYGNALNVMRTVEELEMAGVAGLSIEDTDLPEPFGSSGKTRLLSISEGLGKMKAALAGRRDPKMVIAGRTSAPSISGIDDARKRALAYQACGVDAIFLVGIKNREELESIAKDIRVPIILGGVTPSLKDLSYLASQGVRLCLQGHHPFSASVQAIYDTLRAMRQGVAVENLQNVASTDLMNRLTRADDYKGWARQFLGES